MGAALAVLVGLVLWGTPIGDWWENASYDYQFRFSSRAVTNQVVLIQLDNQAYSDLHQDRYDPNKPGSQPWDRNLHKDLLKKLADGGASLVVMDIFFARTNDPAVAKALSNEMARQKNLVLMAKPAGMVNPSVSLPPLSAFCPSGLAANRP